METTTERVRQSLSEAPPGDSTPDFDQSDQGTSESTNQNKDSFQQSGESTTEDAEQNATTDKLSDAFIAEILDGLEAGKSQLAELTSNQMVLIETVQHENNKFDECNAFKELSNTITKAKLYHTKLLTLKKEMVALHDKSYKVKKRAVKIQQNKQKEELQRANQREKEMERERALMAKPAPAKSDVT